MLLELLARLWKIKWERLCCIWELAALEHENHGDLLTCAFV